MSDVSISGLHDVRRAKLIARLRDARRDQKVTQAGLAKLLNKRQQYVSKYESGERRLDFFEVLEVAAILKIPYEELVALAHAEKAEINERP